MSKKRMTGGIMAAAMALNCLSAIPFTANAVDTVTYEAEDAVIGGVGEVATTLKGYSGKVEITGLFSSFMFGIIYAVNLTPCIGVFLGSALMMASVSANAGKGAVLLMLYSLGLGIPFLISAVLIHELEMTFDFIKKNYHIINKIAGAFLILAGLAVMIFS